MSIPNKILLGIGTFVGVMLLVGWVMINESARMAVFTDQWDGRSVERGAELYLNNCTTCHAVDGLGQASYAPALNNPYFFHNENPARVATEALRALQVQKSQLEQATQKYEENLGRRIGIQTRLNATVEGTEARQQIQAELDALNTEINLYDPRTPEKLAALEPEIVEAQAKLDAAVAQGWDPNRNVRLKELNWAGGLADYFRSTLISGRPTSGPLWNGNIMPAWGQQAGGPLREDEINNLVAYLINYREEALRLTPNDIRQNTKLGSEGAGGATSETPVNQTVLSRDNLLALELTGGNEEQGRQAYQTYGCAGCHSAPGGAAYNAAPTAGTFTRVQNVRLKLDQFKEFTAEQYLADSIIYPNDYIVPNAGGVQMPQNFGDLFGVETLKDLIAYLASQK